MACPVHSSSTGFILRNRNSTAFIWAFPYICHWVAEQYHAWCFQFLLKDKIYSGCAGSEPQEIPLTANSWNPCVFKQTTPILALQSVGIRHLIEVKYLWEWVSIELHLRMLSTCDSWQPMFSEFLGKPRKQDLKCQNYLNLEAVCTAF